MTYHQNRQKKPFWLLIPAAAVIALAVLFATGTLGGGTPQRQNNAARTDTMNPVTAETALAAVAPEGATFEPVDITAASRDAASKQGGKLIEMYTVSTGGYACKVVASGSQGIIQMVVGVDADGAITGISVVNHSETSGIGSRVVNDNELLPIGVGVLDQFIGMSGAGTLEVGKNIMPITGATVSTRGITMGANAALAAVAALWGETEPIHAKEAFKAFFYEYFDPSLTKVALADVTHDGLDEMLVVSRSDEAGTTITGYVYYLASDGEVKEIYHHVGSAFHMGEGGFFNWYIKETATGYDLAREEGYWQSGYGTLRFFEYYLTPSGEMIEVDDVSLDSDEIPIPEGKTAEEIWDIKEEYYVGYDEEKHSRLNNFYTLYYFVSPNDWDQNTKGLFMEKPEVLFDN